MLFSKQFRFQHPVKYLSNSQRQILWPTPFFLYILIQDFHLLIKPFYLFECFNHLHKLQKVIEHTTYIMNKKDLIQILAQKLFICSFLLDFPFSWKTGKLLNVLWQIISKINMVVNYCKYQIDCCWKVLCSCLQGSSKIFKDFCTVNTSFLQMFTRVNLLY